MKTFSIQTLGCKVNHYESEQIAALLRSRGLAPCEASGADLRVIHTCSVTTQAASQSRQSVRRAVRLPILQPQESVSPPSFIAAIESPQAPARRPRIVVSGCWATSDRAAALAMPGVDAVLDHHDDIAAELNRLLTLWQADEEPDTCRDATDHLRRTEPPPESIGDDYGWRIKAGTRAERLTGGIQPKSVETVNVNPARTRVPSRARGATALPLLDGRQTGRQRAFLKIQDGCDAHCTYCIIPTLRPSLWSKPLEDVVEEARAMVGAGHAEVILTGIFLGAYGQPTALRRRQPVETAKPLGALIEALCTRVAGLRRLRLSSLEPGDLTDDLIRLMRSHGQVVPHFHLPLQSGADSLLRRMNRQYTRDDFLRMIDRVNGAFDRPSLTTDVVVGFPGETDGAFEETAAVVRAARFIHVHAFPYSPRPGTAAARWTGQFVRGPIVNQRIAYLSELATDQSFAFRKSFKGEAVEVIVERDAENNPPPALRHGRCERYFPVHFDDVRAQPGDSVRLKIVAVTRDATRGEIIFQRGRAQSPAAPGPTVI